METAEITRIDLAKALKNVTTFLAYQLEQDNIKITSNANGHYYWVMGNNNELEQVITNIILNARDATKQVKKAARSRYP